MRVSRVLNIARWRALRATETELFRLPFSAPSLSTLEGSITLYGQTIAPSFLLRGKDATDTTWPVAVGGGTMVLASAGGNPTSGQPTPTLDAADRSVLFGATPRKYYTLATSAHLLADGNDGVYEFVCKTGGGVTHSPVLAVNGGAGININNTSTSVTLTLDGVAGVANISVTIAQNAWQHCLWTVRRGVNAFGYLNGKPIGATVDISAVTSLIAGTPNIIVGYKNADTVNSIGVAHLGMWQAPAGWITNAMADAWAAERFLRFAGCWPAYAAGASLPTAWSRASVAQYRRYVSGVSVLVPVGTNWPRVDADAVAMGYYAEPAGENEFTYSDDFSNVTWVKTRCSVATNSGVGSPVFDKLPFALIADAVNNTHFIVETITSTAAEHEISIFAKAGAVGWVELEGGSANASCYFDLSTGVLGTAANGGAGRIGAYGNGWYRCTLIYAGDLAAHDHRYYAASADGVNTFAGDGTTPSIYVIGAQHEDSGSGYQTSYVQTVAAAATRAADVLRFDGTGHYDLDAGAIECALHVDDGPAVLRVGLEVSDGTASNVQRLGVEASTSDVPSYDVVRTGSPQAALVDDDVALTQHRSLRATYQGDGFNLYTGGVLSPGSPDTSGTPPVASHINIGSTYGGASQLRGRVSNVRTTRRTVPATAGDFAGVLGLTLGDIYGVVGRQAELHFPPTVNTGSPTSYTYEVTVTPALTATPTQNTEQWAVTPDAGDVGTRTIQLVVKSSGTKIGQRTRRLRVRPNSLTATRDVIFVGDSITEDGRYLVELQTIAGASVNFRGTVLSGVGAIPCEGRGGWTAYMYETFITSPFRTGGVVDIPAYLATLGLTPHIVVWVLGVNDMRAYGAADFCATRMVGSLQTLITAWRVAAPTVKHVLAYGPPCAPDLSADPADLRARMILGYERMLAVFAGEASSGIHVGLDRGVDYGGIDPLHPNATGYVELGRAIWPALVDADRT